MKIDAITDAQVDRAVAALFGAGFDSADIASLLHMPEAAVMAARNRADDAAERRRVARYLRELRQ